MSEAAKEALRVLRVTEGNIRSQWACAGREVHVPFQEWLRVVREAIVKLEMEVQGGFGPRGG